MKHKKKVTFTFWLKSGVRIETENYEECFEDFYSEIMQLNDLVREAFRDNAPGSIYVGNLTVRSSDISAFNVVIDD